MHAQSIVHIYILDFREDFRQLNWHGAVQKIPGAFCLFFLAAGNVRFVAGDFEIVLHGSVNLL